MKMHLIVSYLTVFSLMLHYTFAASAANVGLYAPDRYNGIPETCLMPMDFGYCRAKVKRYYFDMRRMKCAMFYFGGCAGNINNFKTLEDCNRICLDGYGDYDSPNDVVVSNNNKVNGRDYRSRGNVITNSNNNNARNSGSSSNSNRDVNNSINIKKNNTSVTSFGAGHISGVDVNSYKNNYNKYNSNIKNYNTNPGSSSSSHTITNVHSATAGGVGSGVSSSGIGANNNNTKILRSRSDDNLDDYEYEEEI